MGEMTIAPSSKVVDWSREDAVNYWDPGRRLLKTIRFYHRWCKRSGIVAFVAKKVCVVRHRFWSVVSGADIPLGSDIGGGLRIPHPNGIVIYPAAKIGPNCMIFQQVTIGASFNGIPEIGGNVMIGAGAKVLGSIVVADNARIGANAVVVDSVGDGVTVVGIPAKPVKR